MYEYKLSDSVVKDTRLSGSGIHSLGKPNYHFSFDRLDILVRFSEMLHTNAARTEQLPGSIPTCAYPAESMMIDRVDICCQL
jgi:hypothetical protein